MKAEKVSHCPDFCVEGRNQGVEKQESTLSDFTGLSRTDVCGTLVPTEKGGAIMKMTLDQDHERKEGLSQDGVHNKEVIADIIAMLGKAEEWQLKIILRFAKRIIE